MRFLFVPLLAVSLTFLTACAEDKKTEDKPPQSRAEKFADLKATAEKEQGEMFKKFRAAEPEDQAKIRTEAKELYILNATRALRIADENPKDETGLDAAIFAMKELLVFRETGDDMKKAISIITEHHIGSPKLRPILANLGQAGEAGQNLLKTLAEKATDKGVKAVALYMLGSSLAEQVDEIEDEKKAAAVSAEAIAYLEKAVAEAGDTELGNQGSLKEVAGDELTALKTLGVGKPAPEVSGTNLETGAKMKLSDLKGKVVLLDVWATWCGPCKAMIPHERDMVKKLEGKPFQLISVSADDEKDTLKEFLTKTSMPWMHWWDGPDSEVLKKYRVKAFPTLYLIDDKGVIRKKFIGAPEPEVLDKAIDDLVKQAGK